MIRCRMFAVASAILLLFSGGCAIEPSARPAPSGPPPLPPPSNVHMTGTFEINLTPQMVAQTGLPETVKGTLDADAKSEAISALPLRSHHEGHLRLTIADGPGKRTLANVKLDISGDSAGSPTEGLREAIDRFMDAASLMSRPVPQVGTAAVGSRGQ